jgi:hypothetical protein
MPGLIVILGEDGQAAWWQTVIDRAAGAAADGSSQVVLVSTFDGVTFERLSSEAIGLLVLVISGERAAQEDSPEAAPADGLRPHALQAVFAVELARRVERGVAVSIDSLAESLAGLAAHLDPLALQAAVRAVPRPHIRRTLPRRAGVYDDLLEGAISRRQPLQLAWPRELFLDGDTPGKMLPPTVEVGGRARILAYGPYLPLPTGQWTATAYLGFSPDIGRLPFILEMDAGGAVARGFFEVQRGGIFTVSLDFHVARPLQLIEARLISQDSALEGQLALIEMELSEAGAPPPAGLRQSPA